MAFSIHLSRLRSPVHQMVWFMLVMPSASCTHPRSPLYLRTCLRPRLTRLSSSSPTAMWPAPRDYNLALGTYSSLEGIIILVLYCIQFPMILKSCNRWSQQTSLHVLYYYCYDVAVQPCIPVLVFGTKHMGSPAWVQGILYYPMCVCRFILVFVDISDHTLQAV